MLLTSCKKSRSRFFQRLCRISNIKLCLAVLAVLLTSLGLAHGSNDDKLAAILEARTNTWIQEIRETRAEGPAAFKQFAARVSDELRRAGEAERAGTLDRAIGAPGTIELPKQDLASLIRTFAREYYYDEIVEATSRLIRFRTFATDVPNRENPEFIKQKTFLRELATSLDLNFFDVDGYVQEIWIGDGPESLGFMVHSDVQPVDEGAWSVPPWQGLVKDEALWGRGAIDDKGPLAALIYGLRALLDSGLPLQRKLIILVGTDEESANEDVSAYLKTRRAPDHTVVVDYSYPVFCAEKGWCGLWLKLPRTPIEPPESGWYITDLQAGFSPSVVPGEATALVQAVDLRPEEAGARLAKLINRFEHSRAGSKLQFNLTAGAYRLTAFGRQVHSSTPHEGHNALMDLLVFLNDYLKPAANEIALLAKFAATYVGFDLEGQRLGIAHRDPFMGEVTVAANMFQTTADTVMFMFNFRVPQGISKPQLQSALTNRLQRFESLHGVEFALQSYYSAAHYLDPQMPFVQSLLQVYEALTQEKAEARSMSGGTYARHLPNAVVFGPKLANEPYFGHRPDEHIKLSTLERNIEILTHTMANLGL